MSGLSLLPRGLRRLRWDRLTNHHSRVSRINEALVRRVSSLSDRIKTEMVLPGGVIVKMPEAPAKKNSTANKK